MSDPGPETPADRSRAEAVGTDEMSVAEKLACEWEARHDVAARRRIADVAPVQHYLNHRRTEDDLHRPPAGEPRTPPGPPVPAGSGAAVPPGLRQWLRWGEDERRPVVPVIPRC